MNDLGELLPDEKNKTGEPRRNQSPYLLSEISILFALIFFIGMNVVYAENRVDFQTSGSSPVYPDLTLSLLILGSALICISVISFLRVEAKKPVSIDPDSRVRKGIGGIVADAIFQNRRILSMIVLLYGAVFAFLDGMLIYQPTVNFAYTYGVTGTTTVVENCCGPPGYVPVVLVYFPAQHFGIQLIPLSILTMILVSLLVGINVVMLISSIEKSSSLKARKVSSSFGTGKRSFLGGAVGAAFGVFAGCPTCAAAFFLSTLAGSGATAFSLTVSKFQPVIIMLSIPLLIASILWQARSIRTFLLGCPV